ncbi:hypothetical protein [Corynebacterium vitaeruminis]|uniref:hypothetical protein n=1 Tax=Corynebacterium vitaeruminis TaxID=38305 RepID=UPI000A8A0BF3|nr:hypothetical protein [Corynebacterium vitaeruminis]
MRRPFYPHPKKLSTARPFFQLFNKHDCDRSVISLSRKFFGEGKLKKATTAALLSALLLGTTGISCSSTETSGEDVQPVGDNLTTITTDSGVTLPAGVLPPDNPPEPGDAPLGPDGHYNYDAPEFILTNPCDDPEIMGRLDRLGFREQTYMEGRIKGNKQIGCVIESDASDLLSIWHAAVAHSQLERYSAEPLAHHDETFNWVTFTQTEPLGSSACIASVETEKGALGFVIDTTGQDEPDPQHRRCAPVNELLIDYLGEKS